MNAVAFVLLIKKTCDDAGSQKLAAKKLSISPQYLSEILSGRADISANVAKKMGYSRVIEFVPERKPKP